jgi:hypothetical protein
MFVSPLCPGGAGECPDAHTRRSHPATPSPLRSEDEKHATVFHGFRDAQSRAAPPVATARRPSGANKFLSVSSRGNLQTDFTSADAGKTPYDAPRWVSTRSEKGPWI